MAMYKMSNKEFRQKTNMWKSTAYVVYDDGEETEKNGMTIAIKDNEVAIARGDNTWRMPVREMEIALRMLEGHFETVLESVCQYAEIHRNELRG